MNGMSASKQNKINSLKKEFNRLRLNLVATATKQHK